MVEYGYVRKKIQRSSQANAPSYEIRVRVSSHCPGGLQAHSTLLNTCFSRSCVGFWGIVRMLFRGEQTSWNWLEFKLCWKLFATFFKTCSFWRSVFRLLIFLFCCSRVWSGRILLHPYCMYKLHLCTYIHKPLPFFVFDLCFLRRSKRIITVVNTEFKMELLQTLANPVSRLSICGVASTYQKMMNSAF